MTEILRAVARLRARGLCRRFARYSWVARVVSVEVVVVPNRTKLKRARGEESSSQCEYVIVLAPEVARPTLEISVSLPHLFKKKGGRGGFLGYSG
jgi:hypothetical protein